jgi:hypothetical protein
MRYWTNVCVEGHCLALGDICPCGRTAPSPFCLGNGRIGSCPHYGWSDTTERNAAKFVPLRLILWDKLKIYWENACFQLEWWFWGQLWFNRRKDEEFFKDIKVMSDDDPIMVAWHKEEEKAQQKFEKWFVKAKKEW